MTDPENEATGARTGCVAIVDDDEMVLARLRTVLTRQGYEVSTFSSPQAFLRATRPPPPSSVLLDLEMPGMSGLDVQGALLDAGDLVPLVFMTGLLDTPAAIQALKAGAVDYLLKPFSDQALLDAVARAQERSSGDDARRQAVARAKERLAALTKRELQVCQLVAEGLTSREIAEKLGTVEGTISVHRARIMTKLQARSISELVRIVDLAGGRAPTST